jgi:hypothetical protein
MVSAAGGTGSFGNVPRRLLYATGELNAGFVRAVHALSEQAMQRALSVKAGASPLDFKSFLKHVLGPLLRGKEPDHEGMPPALREFMEKPEMWRACAHIRKNIAPQEFWQKWLARPSCMGELLEEAGGAFEAPLADPRIRPFLA